MPTDFTALTPKPIVLNTSVPYYIFHLLLAGAKYIGISPECQVNDVPHVFCPRNVSRALHKYARASITISSWEVDYLSEVPHFVWELSAELFLVFFSVVIGVE